MEISNLYKLIKDNTMKYRIPFRLIEALNACYFIQSIGKDSRFYTVRDDFSNEIDLDSVPISILLDLHDIVTGKKAVEIDFKEYLIPAPFGHILKCFADIRSIYDKWDINTEEYYPENVAYSEISYNFIWDFYWLFEKQNKRRNSI